MYASRLRKESVCNTGDTGSIPRLGRSSEEGNGNLLQFYCLGNPMDRGASWATVHGVTKKLNRTWRLSNSSKIHLDDKVLCNTIPMKMLMSAVK